MDSFWKEKKNQVYWRNLDMLQGTQEKVPTVTAETVTTPGEGTAVVAQTECLLAAEFWMGPGGWEEHIWKEGLSIWVGGLRHAWPSCEDRQEHVQNNVWQKGINTEK